MRLPTLPCQHAPTCSLTTHPWHMTGMRVTLQGQYEIELLENSICKICELLAVGFGDAGAEIISENIKKQGDLNPMMPGRRMVRLPAQGAACWLLALSCLAGRRFCGRLASIFCLCMEGCPHTFAANGSARASGGNPSRRLGLPWLQVAVFGFCDIRRFTDATEVLQVSGSAYVRQPAGCSSAHACQIWHCETRGGRSVPKHAGLSFGRRNKSWSLSTPLHTLCTPAWPTTVARPTRTLVMHSCWCGSCPRASGGSATTQPALPGGA